MPKVKLYFDISGWISQRVEVPQSVIDKYNREIEKDNPDGKALDELLSPYINYDNILDQLNDAEEIELSEIKETAQGAEQSP